MWLASSMTPQLARLVVALGQAHRHIQGYLRPRILVGSPRSYELRHERGQAILMIPENQHTPECLDECLDESDKAFPLIELPGVRHGCVKGGLHHDGGLSSRIQAQLGSRRL